MPKDNECILINIPINHSGKLFVKIENDIPRFYKDYKCKSEVFFEDKDNIKIRIPRDISLTEIRHVNVNTILRAIMGEIVLSSNNSNFLLISKIEIYYDYKSKFQFIPGDESWTKCKEIENIMKIQNRWMVLIMCENDGTKETDIILNIE